MRAAVCTEFCRAFFPFAQKIKLLIISSLRAYKTLFVLKKNDTRVQQPTTTTLTHIRTQSASVLVVDNVCLCSMRCSCMTFAFWLFVGNITRDIYIHTI